MKNVGISAPILASAIALFAVSAQAVPLRSVPVAIAPQPMLRLAQAQDPAVLNFHTEHYSVRIFPRNGDLIMNIFDRRAQTLWLSDLEVIAMAHPEGYVYTTVRSDVPVTVFQSSVDAAVASLTVGSMTESATQVVIATVPPLTATPLPQPVPNPEAVVTCWAFPDIAYLYRQGDRTLMDISNRDQNQTWLQSVPVTPMPSADGTNYLYSGDITVKVFTSAYDGSCAIMVNDNEPEFGIQ